MDADLCIDLQRKFAPALGWLQAQKEPLFVPGFVGVELPAGCENAEALRVMQRFLLRFGVVWPSEAGLNRFLTDLAPLRLSHGLRGFDPLIATTALEQGETLYTFNRKHFQVVPGLVIATPYAKQSPNAPAPEAPE